MEELNAAVDKLLTDTDHLARLTGVETLDEPTLGIALSVAKRVRRQSILTVKLLASQRDKTRYSREA